MEAARGRGLLPGLGVLLVLACWGLGRLAATLRNTRAITHIRVDKWARRHGW